MAALERHKNDVDPVIDALRITGVLLYDVALEVAWWSDLRSRGIALRTTDEVLASHE